MKWSRNRFRSVLLSGVCRTGGDRCTRTAGEFPSFEKFLGNLIQRIPWEFRIVFEKSLLDFSAQRGAKLLGPSTETLRHLRVASDVWTSPTKPDESSGSDMLGPVGLLFESGGLSQELGRSAEFS
jgi:hypothetical protein